MTNSFTIPVASAQTPRLSGLKATTALGTWRAPFRSLLIALAPLVVGIPHCGLARALVAAEETPNVTLQDVIQAWEVRQSRARSIEFEWEQPKREGARWRSYQSAWIPERDADAVRPWNRLKSSGDSVRYETNRWYARTHIEYTGLSAANGLDASLETPDPFRPLDFSESRISDFHRALELEFQRSMKQRRNPRRFTSITNGSVRTEFFDRGTGEYAQAILLDWTKQAETLPGVISDLYFRSLLMTYRPLYPAPGHIRADRCEMVLERSFVNGFDCVLIRETKPTGQMVAYWVDPARDYVIVRYLVSEDGRPRAQLDIEYDADPAFGWVPKSWVALLFTVTPQYFGQELLTFDAEAKVTRYAINATFPDTDFVVKPFPTGTYVVDRIRDEHYIAQRHDGKRLVTLAEASDPLATYRSLTAGKAYGVAEAMRSYLVSGGWVWGIALLIFGTAALIRVHKRICSRTASPTQSLKL